jgi:hypothetical protein
MVTRIKGAAFSASDNLGYISLADVGYVDGVTDNTAVINTALATGTPLYIPAGTFICSPIVAPAGAVIFGAGPSSILKAKAASVTPLLTLGSNSRVRDLAIDGNKGTMVGSGIHGIAVINALNTILDSLFISNTLGDGINISGAATNGVKVITCDITGFVRNGITVQDGADITIAHTKTYSSDAVASPGDGISLAPTSAGASINVALITGCTSRNNVGRGISILGNAGKNVTNITVHGMKAISNTSHGFHVFTAQQVTAHGIICKSNGADGIRLEGDVVYCRVSESIADSNTSFGIREVTTGATPNNNGLIYNVSLGNSTNTITKVGAASFIV